MGVRVRGRAAVVAAVVAVLAGGCAAGSVGPGPATPVPAATSPDPAPPPETAPTPDPAPPATVPAPGAGTVRDTGAPLADPAALGHDPGALLPLDGASLQVEDGSDGSSRTTVVGRPGTVAWVAPPRGGSAAVQLDGSVVLADEAGTAVAALGAPVGTDGVRGRWRTVDDVLALDAPTGSASFVVGTAAVGSATWGDADGGRSLLVVPAGWVRDGSLAAQQALVSQVAAAEPEAASASMQAQLWCHVLGAPDKRSWNVEPWRPEVSTATLLLTRCNPTDVDG